MGSVRRRYFYSAVAVSKPAVPFLDDSTPQWHNQGMRLQFVYLPTFERTMGGLLTDTAMQIIENELPNNPRRGDVIPDTNGVRKMRVALPGRGKRGGGRVTYLYVETKDRVYFILAYAKNIKEDVTPAEIKALASLARVLKGE
jgi:hypothetical protein